MAGSGIRIQIIVACRWFGLDNRKTDV
jgi:hypothetical protein